MDTLTQAERSERMSRVRSKDTKPEMRVRKLVHGMGYRYRLHGDNLPGHPDLIFGSARKVIFVHGCFWHRHGLRCKLTRWSHARFKPLAVVEWDKHACDTIRENMFFGLDRVRDWPLYETDVAEFDYAAIDGEVDLLSAGPPCQPFSLAGKHRGQTDKRNMFPELFRAARELKPKAILVENVKGLLRRSFADYFEYILLQLSYPDMVIGKNESYTSHLSRLERRHTRGRGRGLSYNVVFRLLNAADYGVPQRRERVFIVAIRSDVGVQWSFPDASHSHDALIASKWVDGSYWDRHGIPQKHRLGAPERLRSKTRRLRESGIRSNTKPWLTVRDAIGDLPDPRKKSEARKISNHVFQPGARAYPGHTGSPLDDPAKTLKAGDHGVPGGENMIAYSSGEVRYFTVRESARLQTFPDEFVFHGSWTETMRQLGNAVPVSLARILAKEIHGLLSAKAKPPKKKT